MESTSTMEGPETATVDGNVMIGEQGSAVVTVVFATVCICYANLANGDHHRMVLSAIAALGTVTMAIVSLALRKHNVHPVSVPASAPEPAVGIGWPAIGLVVVGLVVVASQVLLWT